MAEADDIGAALGADEAQERDTDAGAGDAVAMALALDAAHHDPHLGPAARRYLDRQRTLVDLQIRHFEEEHTLAIAAARRKGFMDRTRICLQLLVAVVIAGVLLAVALMLWDALNDRSVVVDALSVPEDLAQRGYTGEVLAKHILDRLNEINNASGTIRAANSYANSLGGDIKLEIPETGVSIGELSRVLHEKLGHTTHVSGELLHAGDALTIRIRLGDDYEAESTGPEASLTGLLQDASTKIYAQTQAYRYGFWLSSQDDMPAATAIFRDLAATGPFIERVWALHGLAIVATEGRDSIRYDRQALELDPAFSLSHLTIGQVEYIQGHDEAALKEVEKAIAAPADGAGLSRHGVAVLRAGATGYRDSSLGDYLGALATDRTLADIEEGRLARLDEWRTAAVDLARLHDFSAAADILERLPQSRAADAAASAQSARLDVRLLAAKSLYLVQHGEWQAAIPGLERIRSDLPTLRGTHAAEALRTSLYPWLAEAYARVGRDADADAVLAQMPSDVYDGWRARGRVAALRHDYAAADTDFAEAVRQAPSIPRAFQDWGDMLAVKGDLAAAIGKYALANRLGPHWADPLKAWGDALAHQGQPRDAAQKYRQALPHAPHWEDLQARVDAARR